MSNIFLNELSQLMWEKNLQQYITASNRDVTESNTAPYGDEVADSWNFLDKAKEPPQMPDSNNDIIKAFTETLGRGDVKTAIENSQRDSLNNARGLNDMTRASDNFNPTLAANMRANQPSSKVDNNTTVTNNSLPQFQNSANSNIVSAWVTATTTWAPGGTTYSAGYSINFVNAGQAVGNFVAPKAQAAVQNILSPQSRSAPVNSPNNPSTQTKAPSPESVGRQSAISIANQVFNAPSKAGGAPGSSVNLGTTANGRPTGRGSFQTPYYQ
jgi:hypothetical protein